MQNDKGSDIVNQAIIAWIKRIIILFFMFLTVTGSLDAQPKSFKKAEQIQKQRDRKERKLYEKQRKATLKHRYEIQTEQVQKRMKLSKQKAVEYNKQKRSNFIREFFDKQKKKRKRR